jgi:hypothetical protein
MTLVAYFFRELPRRHMIAFPCMSRQSSSHMSPMAKMSGSITTARPW